jgi:hypothetical protein
MQNVLSTFVELYKSFGPVNLGPFFEMFDSATVPAPAARFLRFLTTSDDTAKVLVYVTGTVDAPRVGVVHGLFRFLPSMTGPTPWDGQVYALHDDIVDASRAVTPLVIPGAIFNKTATVHVPTVATMGPVWAAHVAATPDVACLEDITAGDPNTEPITTRNYMGVPNQYVELVMSKPSRTPSEFWHEVCERIIADGEAVDCVPLIDWGRVVSTYATPNVNLLHGHQPTPVLPDAAFRKRLTAKVDKELPVVSVAPVQAAAAFPADASQAITNLCALQAASLKPKTLKVAMTYLFNVVARFIGSTDSSKLPPYWVQYAATGKSDRINLLASALREQAESSTGNKVWAHPTPALGDVITTGAFAVRSSLDLMAGLTIFHINTSPDGSADAQKLAFLFENLHSGNVAPSLGEIHELKATKACIPSTCFQCLSQLQAYTTLMMVLFGENSPFVGHLQDFVSTFALHLGTFESLFKGVEGGIEGMLGRFLMKFHILTQAYFWVRLSMPYDEQPPLPCYQKLIDAITQQEWPTLPYLPASTMKPVAEGGGKKTARSGGAANTSGGGVATTTGAAATTLRAGASASPAVAAVQQVKNENDVSVALVQRFEGGGKLLGELTKRDDITKAFVDGTARTRIDQICLAYHLRKACYSGCGRCSSHRKLSTTEVAKVAQFLTDAGVP